MNTTNGLEILARQNPLTENDWLTILEGRRVFLKPHLRSMTLKTLGDLKIVQDDISRHAGDMRKLRIGRMVERTLRFSPYGKYIEPAEPNNIEGSPFSLKTTGIFADDEIFHHGHYRQEFVHESDRSCNGRILKFWGLTRNGEWIKIECVIEYVIESTGVNSGIRRANVTKIKISKSEPLEICRFCKVSVRWLWERLGDAIDAKVEHRRKLLTQAEELQETIRHESYLVALVEAKK